MRWALLAILLACAAILVLAFITGRVSAITRRTYLPKDELPRPKDESPPTRT